MLEAVGKPVDVHQIDETSMRRAIEIVAKFASENCSSSVSIHETKV
jgi:hypothetical protein